MLFKKWRGARRQSVPCNTQKGDVIEIHGSRDPLAVLDALPRDIHRVTLVIERDWLWPENWKVIGGDAYPRPHLRSHNT